MPILSKQRSGRKMAKGGSLLKGRWSFRQGKFNASVSMTCSSQSEASLTSASTAASTMAPPSESAPTPNDNTQWPWMKNTKCRIDHPIAHVDEHDKRPPVAALILKHRKEIDQLKARLKSDPLYVAAANNKRNIGSSINEIYIVDTTASIPDSH